MGYVSQSSSSLSFSTLLLVLPTSLTSPEMAPVPSEYHDLLEVFLPSDDSFLLPHYGRLDHHIPLVEGTKPVYNPIYNLSEMELQVLKNYVEEYLRKGFIRPSTSPFGSSVLFVKKANGDLRLCVDYCALNHVTVKNRYILPLILELLDRIKEPMFHEAGSSRCL